MNFVISPGARTGAVRIPASKSQAHRLLICAALGKAPVTVRCDGLNADILATAACLRALGANIAEQDGALHVEPIKAVPDGLCVLPWGMIAQGRRAGHQPPALKSLGGTLRKRP